MIKREINRVKLFVNNNEKAKQLSLEVTKKFLDSGFEIADSDYTLAIAIGGDGSFLRMVKKTNFNSDIYYVGINARTLGFAQEIDAQNLDSFISCLNNNNYKLDYIGIQETKVATGKDISRFYSLNEIVIRDKDLNTAIFNVMVDNVLLEKFVGDGLLIATSFGSTAYNLSFGGSIVYSCLHTLQITPIAPLNNKSYRNLLNSVVIPETKVVTLYPEYENNNLINTICLFADINCQYISSSVVKEVFSLGKNIEDYVDETVIEAMNKKEKGMVKCKKIR